MWFLSLIIFDRWSDTISEHPNHRSAKAPNSLEIHPSPKIQRAPRHTTAFRSHIESPHLHVITLAVKLHTLSYICTSSCKSQRLRHEQTKGPKRSLCLRICPYTWRFPSFPPGEVAFATNHHHFAARGQINRQTCLVRLVRLERLVSDVTVRHEVFRLPVRTTQHLEFFHQTHVHSLRLHFADLELEQANSKNSKKSLSNSTWMQFCKSSGQGVLEIALINASEIWVLEARDKPKWPVQFVKWQLSPGPWLIVFPSCSTCQSTALVPPCAGS